MAIRRSLSGDVSQLVAQLTSGTDVERESAGARLSVIGVRAAVPLARVADDPSVPPEARVTAFRALVAMNDRRAPALARTILRRLSSDPDHGEPGAVEAIEVLSASARSRSASGTEDFEQLTEIALDARLPDDLRLAAIRALKQHPRATVGPILDALSQDRRTAIVAEASGVVADSDPALTPIDIGEVFETGRVEEALTAVAGLSADTPVTKLRRLVDRARAREKVSPDDGPQWRVVRGELHRALAHRGSRLAVYDLRETFDEATAPLPVGFVAAAAEVGDASCLEPLVRAWLAGAEEGPGSWRDHLGTAFGAIVGREGLTRQHAVLRRILERWPAAGSLVALAPKRPVSTTSRTRL